MSLQAALPVFCLCDAEDGERTSILGIEKGKNKELIHYKITVGGPVTSTHPTIQFNHLKSEMAFLTGDNQVSIKVKYLICKIVIPISLLRSLQLGRSPFMKLIEGSI